MRVTIEDRNGNVLDVLQSDDLRGVIVYAYENDLHVVGWIDPHDVTRFTSLQVRVLRRELGQVAERALDATVRQTAQDLLAFVEPAERPHRFLHFADRTSQRPLDACPAGAAVPPRAANTP